MDKVIDTGRLILRRFTLDDLQAFYQLCSRPEIIRFAQSTPLASLEEARAMMDSAPFHDYATYGYGRFACVWKESGAVVGFSGVLFFPETAATGLIAASLLLIGNTLLSSPVESLAGLALVAAGLPAYWLWRRRARAL